MVFRTLVVAPHPDDELLGCGGTLLRRKAEGGTIGWLLMTAISATDGWDVEKVNLRAQEIQRVRDSLGIKSEHHFSLGFPSTRLEQVPTSVLIQKISNVFSFFEPEEVLLPYPGDVHSDHRVTFEAVSACTKWFRYPSVRRVLAYETPSETDFGIDPRYAGYQANYFVDIGLYLERKLSILNEYSSELGKYPFPRSREALQALARVRGAQSGFDAAESFMLLRARI